MTVDKIVDGAEEGPIQCVWFNQDGNLVSASFHEAQLVLVKKTQDV